MTAAVAEKRGDVGMRMTGREAVTAAVAGLRGDVVFDAPLDVMTSLRVGGPADAVVYPADVQDVCRVVRQSADAAVPLMVLGGTNLLVKDGGVRGVVLNLSNMNAINEEVGGDTDGATAGATADDVAGDDAAATAAAGDDAAAGMVFDESMMIAAADDVDDAVFADAGAAGSVTPPPVALPPSATDHVTLFAEAGVRMPVLLGFAVARGWSGLEWAAGIPGTVGGAVAMNAGTRLGEMKDCLAAVRVVCPDGRVVTRAAEALSFAYRRTTLPDGVVVGAWLRLTPAVRRDIAARTGAYLRYRKQSQPLSLPNAGSVFKNPPGTTAGRLIEDAGLKGRRVGDAQVSPMHANFIVNTGRARADDVLRLIDMVQRDVWRRSGVALELEWRVVGEDARPADADAGVTTCR